MGEHYTLNTVETSAWCAKCEKRTPHRVQGRKLGPCLGDRPFPHQDPADPVPIGGQTGRVLCGPAERSGVQRAMKQFHIISLGAGVQSSTMALMAAAGEITPMPDAAVFADTQDEPGAVYEHLQWLKSVLPFPVHGATAGKLSKRLLDGYEGARTPFFIKGGGMSTRHCTRDFKIRPIRRKVREIVGVGARDYIAPDSVTQWIGISTDEADRMKPSGVRFTVNRWPLLEDKTLMSRKQCAAWLWDRFQRVAPKSACKQCPYQETERLLHLQQTDPSGFAELCDFDAALRTPEQVKRFHGELFVHKTCIPLVQIDLAGLVADKAYNGGQQELFTSECEGMCGI